MSAFGSFGSPDQQRGLLRVVRQAARRRLGGQPGTGPAQEPAIAGRFGGVFVTFWAGKKLRGCMGTFAATSDLVATVREIALKSLADPRFVSQPVTAEELERLDIEISVLSDTEPTDDPLSLIPGTHGIVVQKGTKSGCFLPKVAAERGWSAEEFLSNCCTMKAGLPSDAWREPHTEVLLFTAHAFSESQF